MTMRSRLLLLLVVAAIVGGAFYFLGSPAAPVDGGTTVPAGGGAQTSRQGNPVGDVRLESLDRQDDAQVDAQPRCIPIRREACGYCRTTATNASSAGRACATSADRTATASSDSAPLHRVSRSSRGSPTSRGAE